MYKYRRPIVILVAGCVITACVSVTRVYYLPTNPEHVVENKSCGWVPSGGYYTTLTEDVALSINATPESGGLWLSIQYILRSKNATIRMDDKTIYIQSPNQVPIEINATSSNSNLSSLDPTIEIKGSKKNDIQVSNYKIERFSPQEFTLSLPPLVASGKHCEVKPIKFKIVQKTGVLACVQ